MKGDLVTRTNSTFSFPPLRSPVAEQPPPLPPGSVMEGQPPPHYWEGDMVRYWCPPNMVSPNGTNSTTAFFNGTHWVLEDPDFECLPGMFSEGFITFSSLTF